MIKVTTAEEMHKISEKWIDLDKRANSALISAQAMIAANATLGKYTQELIVDSDISGIVASRLQDAGYKTNVSGVDDKHSIHVSW